MDKKKTKKIKSLHPKPYTLNPFSLAGWVLCIVIISVFLFTSLTHPALADPHAMFYTDKGQQQVFYNILAALNQADYVEKPAQTSPKGTDPARISSDIIIGDYIATHGDLPSPEPVVSPEPEERSYLPRIMVRQVTTDNGDVFYRQQLAQRAYAEEIRAILSFMACRNEEVIYGPSNKDGTSLCPPVKQNGTP